MFEWDVHNLRKISAHQVAREEVEQALSNDPILIYEQEFDEEIRSYTTANPTGGRFLALIVTDREERIRVITAYDLDLGQKREYLMRRLEQGSIDED